MDVVKTKLSGVLIIEPRVLRDDRGYFLEVWNSRSFAEIGLPDGFVQDNLSFSKNGVLRGLHYQFPHQQGKLVSVLQGEVFDVAVDIRVGSPTFGKWVGATLSAENHRQLYVPEGFAHGFVVTSETALFTYKCTDFYHPEAEGIIRWNDPAIGIEWPNANPVLNQRDSNADPLSGVSPERLPTY